MLHFIQINLINAINTTKINVFYLKTHLITKKTSTGSNLTASFTTWVYGHTKAIDTERNLDASGFINAIISHNLCIVVIKSTACYLKNRTALFGHQPTYLPSVE